MFSKILVNAMYDSKTTYTKLSKRIGISLQNLSNKKIRDNFSEAEMRQIADALDMELVIKLVPRDEQ